ncbi:ABATE domain-containing protein [Rhizobium sp. CNPSo 4039]|uniref:CGNR zinc finger domain-containing protein n=1 Tax=Rhizobium sp. CNPSo 4039 TaxID=3021409 RepID=UPI00254CDAFF|nr:ABATE domain-containing protein [Rhizobium sp. CNPSo 4039]MDK4713545.1 CGNR zinc finger domain-containing protein [Rhizobium sp. CNPSo 4039]
MSSNEDRRSGVASDPKEELAIRFVNTAAWRLRSSREERLPNAQAFLQWLAGNIPGSEQPLALINARWRAHPQGSAKAYEAAIALREAVYELLVARIADVAPPIEALEHFNALLVQPADGIRLGTIAGELVWCIDGASDPDLLKPIIMSAVNLMTGPKAHRIRQCQDDRGCGWLFVDESRAMNRRWCSMGDCGNRAKAQRHYRRSRGKSDSPSS